MKLRSVSLRELWSRNEVAQACGGYINKLVQALIKDASCSWDIEFHADVLEKGGEVEDAVMIILKDFEEPERQTYPALDGAGDDDDDDTKDSIVRSADSDSDDDEDDTASRADRGNNEEWQTLQGPPKLSKKQKKMKRMEEAPFLAPIFPIEKAPVWMPEKGSEEAAGWEEWTAPARASTMITEQEWAEETGDKAASGWD